MVFNWGSSPVALDIEDRKVTEVYANGKGVQDYDTIPAYGNLVLILSELPKAYDDSSNCVQRRPVQKGFANLVLNMWT